MRNSFGIIEAKRRKMNGVWLFLHDSANFAVLLHRKRMEKSFTGKVVQGNQLGRTIGFPTANLQTEGVVLPKGVFACRVVCPEEGPEAWEAMMNVGTRPTVSSAPTLSIEVHIFDFCGNLYGKNLQVEIVAQIRSERKFADLEELRKNLEQDRQTARKLLSNACH